MFEFQFKDIPENGSFAGKTIILPTPDDKEAVIDTLPKSPELSENDIKKYFEHQENIKQKIIERNNRNKNKI